MYGFGDDQNPYAETVELLEDLVLEFITDIVSTYARLSLLVMFYELNVNLISENNISD